MGVVVSCLVSCVIGCDKEVKTDEAPMETASIESKGAPEDAPAEALKASPKEEAPKAAKIQGECVKDVKADAVARLTNKLTDVMESDEIEASVQVRDFADLDGDGASEMEATVFPYASNMEVVLYLSNQGCAVYAGDFLASSIEASSEKSEPGAIKRVRTWTKGGCAGLEGDFETYAFDGAKKMFVGAETISCSCDLTKDRPKECPTP